MISGTGTLNIHTYLGTTTFEINTPVTITVTSKDSSGANLSTGGKIIYVEISNLCTKGANFAWVPNSGTKISTSTRMTDNLDGTYTYNYQVPMPGTITVSVLLYTQGGVYSEYFPNIYKSGNNVYKSFNSTINLANRYQYVYPGRVSYLSANFYFRFKSPTTGTLNFSIAVDDIVSMYIGNDCSLNI